MEVMLVKDLDIQVSKRVVIIGQDAEYADYDNREGYIYRERYYVTAETKTGSLYNHYRLFENQIDAEIFAHKVRNAKEINTHYWEFDRYTYGSVDYQRYGGEQDLIELERREAC